MESCITITSLTNELVNLSLERRRQNLRNPLRKLIRRNLRHPSSTETEGNYETEWLEPSPKYYTDRPNNTRLTYTEWKNNRTVIPYKSHGDKGHAEGMTELTKRIANDNLRKTKRRKPTNSAEPKRGAQGTVQKCRKHYLTANTRARNVTGNPLYRSAGTVYVNTNGWHWRTLRMEQLRPIHGTTEASATNKLTPTWRTAAGRNSANRLTATAWNRKNVATLQNVTFGHDMDNVIPDQRNRQSWWNCNSSLTMNGKRNVSP